MKLPHLKEFHYFLPRLYQDEGLFVKDDPWWRWAKSAVDFNSIREEEFVEVSNIFCIDETISAWCPQTTATGGLLNNSFIQRKPEPLGTEFKQWFAQQHELCIT